MAANDGSILITGANGMLASACRRIFAAADGWIERCVWTDVAELDITDAGAVRAFVEKLLPAVVINCAAMTDVDGCESRRDEAMLINGEAVGHLARACNMVGAELVQISTDFVFSGDIGRPYVESDAPGPLSVYGESKLLGEQLAAEAQRHLIVRTSWLFGPQGRNFVAAIYRQALLRDELKVVDDQTGCPTYTDHLAEAVQRLVEAGAEGVYHASGAVSCSWWQFAREIVRRVRPEVCVMPMSSEELDRPARRPALSVLNCDRLHRCTGYQPAGFHGALDEYLPILKQELAGGNK